MNNGNLIIDSFEWASHDTQPSVDFSVCADLVYEDLDVIDVDIFNHVEKQLDDLQTQFDELEQDNSSLKTMFDELTIKYNELVASKKVSWKFWK